MPRNAKAARPCCRIFRLPQKERPSADNASAMTSLHKRRSPGHIVYVLACVLLLLRGAHSGVSAQSVTPNYAEARGHARKVEADARPRHPGLAIWVQVDGHVWWYTEGFGYADIEQRVAAWPGTRFRIGSISRPLDGHHIDAARRAAQNQSGCAGSAVSAVILCQRKSAKITPRLLAGHRVGSSTLQGR